MRSFDSFSRRLGFGSLALSFLALTVGGCGTRTGTISGKVLYQGKPLPGGYVNFTSEGPKAIMKNSPIQADGSYSVSGMPVGPAKIAVQGLAARKLAQVPGKERAVDRAEQKEVFVPAKYYTTEQSGLTYDVKPGAQSHDIDLK